MYTAIIKNKEFVGGAIKITVDFSDGVTTVSESCIPQNEDGFKHWVRSRLETFNSGRSLDTALSVSDTVDGTDPVVQPPVPTAEEIARDEWLKNYRKWVSVKKNLIDTGIFTGNEAPAVALKNKVTNDLVADYLNYI